MSSGTEPTLRSLPELGVAIAPLLLATAPEIDRRFRDSKSVSFKADGSSVTDTDTWLEATLIPELQKRYPGAVIIGEESSAVSVVPYEQALAADIIIAVDAIDGTQNFLRGITSYGTSIGLLRKEPDGHRCVDGIISFPSLGELYYRRGDAVVRQRIPSGEVQELEPVRDAATPPYVMPIPDYHVAKARVAIPGTSVSPRIFGSAIADILCVASGSGVGAFGDWALWDFAGGLALAQQLGVQLIDRRSGAIKTHFTKNDFEPPVLSRSWELVKHFVLASPLNSDLVRAVFRDCDPGVC